MPDNVNEAPCPFCGKNCWGEGGFDDVCEHLVAEWSSTPWEQPGVGEQPSDCHAFDSVGPLIRAGQELQSLVGEDGEATGWEARFELLESALPPNLRPGWWSELCDAVRYRTEISPGLAEQAPDMQATWIMTSLLDDVPGIQRRKCLLGAPGYGEGEVWFAWSQDPTAATSEISKRIMAATQIVRNVVEHFSGADR
jgi:hypothetical protein